MTFCRQFLSSLVAIGAAGKTALRIVQAFSVATGRNLTDEYVHRRARVLFLCFEDGIDELERRLQAAMLHHNISADEIRGWFFYETVARAKLLVTTTGQARQQGELVDWLRKTIRELGVELVIFDPFIKTHGVPENDNTAMDEVVTILAQLGIELNIAPDYLHHVPKGISVAGNADAGRGAGAAKDAGRLGYTLTPMSKEDAEFFGISDNEIRQSLVRMDSAKVNIAPPLEAPMWFRLVGVELNNRTIEYPNGDTVQTVERWYPPDPWTGISTSSLNTILDEIAKGLADGWLYSHEGAAKDRAAWRVITKRADRTEKQAREMIKSWIKNGVLTVVDYRDEKDRKDRKGLRVNDAKRPGKT